MRATARLTHWNTVEIFDYGHAEDRTFYYVMEYLPGMNLDDLVKMHGPLHPDRIVHLLKQLCEALREAHDQGLIHRDIKPANVFASQRGGVFDTGSPLYMSPEQAVGERVDERSDLYSLGAVGWFLAVGRAPFMSDNSLKVLLAHAHETPLPPSQFNSEISPELDAVILQCLDKNRARRPASARELRQLLHNVPVKSGWSETDAADWWSCHGCCVKKELDASVFAARR